MPAAVLTPLQEEVLRAVSSARPHAIPEQIARDLGRKPSVIQRTLDALTRRNFVTPIGAWGSNSSIYVCTHKGKTR